MNSIRSHFKIFCCINNQLANRFSSLSLNKIPIIKETATTKTTCGDGDSGSEVIDIATSLKQQESWTKIAHKIKKKYEPRRSYDRRRSLYGRPLPKIPEEIVKQQNSFKPLAVSRCGVIGIKQGMLTMWDAWGGRISATVVKIGEGGQVLAIRPALHSMDANVTVGYGTRKLSKTSMKVLSLLSIHQKNPLLSFSSSEIKEDLNTKNDEESSINKSKKNIMFPLRIPAKVASFHVTEDAQLPVGTIISASHYRLGSYINVRAYTRGHGFTGVMKRWNFRGQGASHGVSKAHRKRGATGGRTNPGRVFPGTKMAGRMGYDYRLIRNLRIIRIDHDDGIIYLKGPIPGPVGCYVDIMDSQFHPTSPSGEIPTSKDLSASTITIFKKKEEFLIKTGIEVLGNEDLIDPYEKDIYIKEEKESKKIIKKSPKKKRLSL